MDKNRLKIIAAFGTVVVVLVWLLTSGFNENMNYFTEINELKSKSASELQMGLRVRGLLVSGSLVVSDTSLEKTFRISDGTEELQVHYDGLLPDTFKEGAEVLVEGRYLPEGYFEAKTVMAKCPSKYEASDGYETRSNEGEKDAAAGTN